ncbi:MAG: hypothetical protein ACTSX1_04460 [Candidatus Heimdallarchaeaceae archaeon]
MRKKTLTMDCLDCDDMTINDKQEFQCEWGKGGKILEEQKGKDPLRCKLILKGNMNET